MANYASLKAAIQEVVKTNGNNEITGALLQQSLLAMINSLGVGYQFMGIAVLTPTPTNPGTPDQNVFYIASEPGTYSNFSGIVVGDDEVAILKGTGSNWTKETTGCVSNNGINILKQQLQLLKDAIEDYTPVEITNFTDHGYIRTSDQTIAVSGGVPVVTSNNSYRCAVVSCVPGDIFIINAKSSRDCAPWCFADSSYNILDKTHIPTSELFEIEWENVVAPENAAWLIINDARTFKKCFKGATVQGNARAMNKKLSDELGLFDNSIFELGNITITRNNLSYSNSTVRARTKQSKYIHLRIGDIISFGGDDIQFYIGWFDGTGWASAGWLLSPYTVTVEADYLLLARKRPESTLDSAEDIFGRFFIVRKNGKQDQLISGVSIKTINGRSVLGAGNIVILRGGFVKRPIKSIAHRGCHILLNPTRLIPEGSEQAFIQAAKNGFDTLEFDVQFTSDGIPVIFHDNTINNVAMNPDGTEISTPIEVINTTYTDLMQYDYGIRYGANYAGTKLLTLQEGVSIAKNLGMDIMPEIKRGFNQNRLQEVINIVSGFDMLENCIWQALASSGGKANIDMMLSYNQTINILYLVTGADVSSDAIEKALSAIRDINRVYIGASYTYLTQSGIELCKSNGIPLMLFTVDSPEYMVNDMDPYVCGVLSDHTAAQKLLRDTLIARAVE